MKHQREKYNRLWIFFFFLMFLGIFPGKNRLDSHVMHCSSWFHDDPPGGLDPKFEASVFDHFFSKTVVKLQILVSDIPWCFFLGEMHEIHLNPSKFIEIHLHPRFFMSFLLVNHLNQLFPPHSTGHLSQVAAPEPLHQVLGFVGRRWAAENVDASLVATWGFPQLVVPRNGFC